MVRGAGGGLGGGLTAWVGRVARPLPGREREFGVYWIATFLINAGWGLTMPLLSVHLFETGMNLAAVGVIQALAGLAAFLSQGVLGTLSDRRATRRRYLILATGATVPVFLVLPHLRDGLSLALAVTFNGLLMATYITMLYTSVSALGRPGAAGRTFAVYRISGSIGWSITTLLLGWVLPWGGIVGAYRLGAGLFAVVTLFLVLGLRHRAGGPGIPEGLPASPSPPATRRRRTPRPGYWRPSPIPGGSSATGSSSSSTWASASSPSPRQPGASTCPSTCGRASR